MASPMVRKYLAEFLGTFGLLLGGGGAAVFSLPLASALGFDPLARVVLVSLAFGATLIGLIWAFGDLSGGHFNPAVTVSMAVSGRMPVRDVVPYILCQLVGGILAMAVVLGIVLGGPSGFSDAVKGAALGSQAYSGNGSPGAFSLGAVFLTELALSFLFITVIQLGTKSENPSRFVAALPIGLTLMITNLVAIPIDGASMNPARSFSPAVVSLYWSWSSDGWALTQSWLFWVAPILGGVLAALVERMLRPD
jgi:aquaporin Z